MRNSDVTKVTAADSSDLGMAQVGRNYLDGSGNIVGVWRCDCNGPRLLSGVYTSVYNQYPTASAPFK